MGEACTQQTGCCHPGTCIRSDEQIDPPEGERAPGKRQNWATRPKQQLVKRSKHSARLTMDVTEVTHVDGRNHNQVAGSDGAADGRGLPSGVLARGGEIQLWPSQTLPRFHLARKKLQRELECGLSRVKDP